MDDAVRIAFASGLPYAGLRDHHPDEPLLAAVPLARRLGLLPVALHGHHLTLATPTPTPDLGDLPTHFHITLVISPAAEITAALARATPPEAPPHWSAARPETPWPTPAARTEEVPPPRLVARVEEPPQSAARAEQGPPEPDARPEPSPSAPRPVSRRDEIARRLGLAVVDHLQPDPVVLARLDDTAQRRLRGVPLALDGDVLYVAIADRFGNYQPETGGGQVRYVVADGGALDELLGSLHGGAWAAVAAEGEPKRAKPVAPARPRDAEPPTTSLLLPLTGGVGATVHAATTLASLDHPADRLEVLLLVAARDASGARAAHALADGPGHRVITLPPELPADRDAALHYGLLLARGEHVAVLDPGDIPAPGLLGAADRALAAPDVAAAQAQLDPPAPAQRGPAWHRHAPLARTGVVVRRDVAEDLGGWRQLDRRLRRAGLRIAPLTETVATAGERS
jgi:hypothetical protein